METINGVSPDFLIENDSYSNNGGISLFSADDKETIFGGSKDDGSNVSSSRIYWTITRVPDSSQPDGYAYSGGITGVSWYTEIEQSPFYNEKYDEPSEIWAIASANGNLSIIFDEWNSDISHEGEIKRSYFMFYLSVNARGCSSTTTG